MQLGEERHLISGETSRKGGQNSPGIHVFFQVKLEVVVSNTLPETKPASLHLKMDGWKTT